MEIMVMRTYLGIDVLSAARKRIEWAFDNFPKIYVSFSGGKDSTVMMHLVMDEAIKRNRKVGVLFIDWECQYALTIKHVKSIYEFYSANIEPYWVALPMLTDNACSMFEPEWIAWEESKKELWTREKDAMSISDKKYFPFYYDRITFEEFVPLFGEWYSDGERCACFVGIRTQESLNRYRALSNKTKTIYDDKMFTTCVADELYNIYPIYDWAVEDDWTYFGKYNRSYNKLYDRFYQAGLTLNQMRVDEPFGDTTRRSLWLYQVIEPKTWSKMVLRLSGANSGTIYSKENGNVLGNGRITLPKGHTWESFSNLLLNTMPHKTAEHFKSKIAVYIKWYMDRGYENGIPDEADYKLEQMGKVPSWRKICKTLLRNDYWCKMLGFSPTKSSAYQKYMELMKRRRQNWNIFNDWSTE
jgi:predicted phosphoadenosine phosphosulfate sulfurtransferase